jgi:hypothetical protein
LTATATRWWNNRAVYGQGPAYRPPAKPIEIPKTWTPAVIPVPQAKPQSAPLGHKELKVLNRLTDGCTLTRVNSGWRLSSANPKNEQAYCKIKPKIIDRLAELGHVAKWGDKVAITGKGSALIGRGSVARIA